MSPFCGIAYLFEWISGKSHATQVARRNSFTNRKSFFFLRGNGNFVWLVRPNGTRKEKKLDNIPRVLLIVFIRFVYRNRTFGRRRKIYWWHVSTMRCEYTYTLLDFGGSNEQWLAGDLWPRIIEVRTM